VDNFVGYPTTPEYINSYLHSLNCGNGKAKFYSYFRPLSRRAIIEHFKFLALMMLSDFTNKSMGSDEV